MISIFRKSGSLKSDWGSSPLRPPLDTPLQLPVEVSMVEVHHKTKILRRFQIRSSNYLLRSCNSGTAQNFHKILLFYELQGDFAELVFSPLRFFLSYVSGHFLKYKIVEISPPTPLIAPSVPFCFSDFFLCLTRFLFHKNLVRHSSTKSFLISFLLFKSQTVLGRYTPLNITKHVQPEQNNKLQTLINKSLL